MPCQDRDDRIERAAASDQVDFGGIEFAKHGRAFNVASESGHCILSNFNRNATTLIGRRGPPHRKFGIAQVGAGMAKRPYLRPFTASMLVGMVRRVAAGDGDILVLNQRFTMKSCPAPGDAI